MRVYFKLTISPVWISDFAAALTRVGVKRFSRPIYKPISFDHIYSDILVLRHCRSRPKPKLSEHRVGHKEVEAHPFGLENW